MDKHSKNSLPISLPLIFIILFSHLAHADSFEVNVPDRGALAFPYNQPIRHIELFVDLPIATTGIVDFRVTRGLVGDPDFKIFQ